MVRGLTVVLVLGAVAVLGWARIDVVEERLALREQQLSNTQAVLEAIADSGRVRASDLEPHLGELVRYDDGFGWVVHAPERASSTTSYPEVVVEFADDGALVGVFSYKP